MEGVLFLITQGIIIMIIFFCQDKLQIIIKLITRIPLF